MRGRPAVLLGSLVLAFGVLEAAAQKAPPEPTRIQGKCAKALGGQYDPVKKGWYTSSRSWSDCVAKGGRGYNIR